MKPVDLSAELEHFKGLWVALTDSDKVISSHKSAQEAYREAIKKGYKEPILFKVPKHDLPHVG
jgi:hypothetical protein